MKNRPLEGIKVVELAGFVAAPSCAKILADMGADVTKIEVMNGDPWRGVGRDCTNRGDIENPIYDVYNAGKKSICLNIKAPGGIECLYKLLENTDVFVTNMRLKSLKKASLDGETLLSRFPRLIHASITGYGNEGPDANAPGFDGIAFWAKSGFLSDMSLNIPGSYPVLAPTGMGDTITGMALYGAIATALYNREKTGKGECVTTSLYANAIWAMCCMVIRGEEKYGERFPKYRYEDSPVTCPYRCADGEWMAITILEYDRYAPALYEILGVTDKIVNEMKIHTIQDVLSRREEVIPVLEKAFLRKSAAEWKALISAADITCCVMNHFKDVEHDPQAWANGYLYEMTMRNGETVAMPRTPMHLASGSMEEFCVASMPGDDTADVLKTAGLSDDEIIMLRAQGAVK